MSAVVRAFYRSGTSAAPVAAGGGRFTSDSLLLVKEPYLARDNVTVSTGAAQSIDAAPSGTKMLHLQVQAGKAVHVEVNPPNRSTAADTSSPIYSGDTMLEFGPGWSASFLECEVV